MLQSGTALARGNGTRQISLPKAVKTQLLATYNGAIASDSTTNTCARADLLTKADDGLLSSKDGPSEDNVDVRNVDYSPLWLDLD